MTPLTKTERRARRRAKRKVKLHAGGTLGGLRTKLAVTKGFKGTSRRLAQTPRTHTS